MRSGTESVLQPRSSRELKFSSSTWMYQQQQQRLLLWRSLQSSSHVNITAVCRYRPEPPGEPTPSCPEAAASRPGSGLTELRRTPHRTAQPRTDPHSPAESRTEFWPVSLRRVCSEMMRCCWYRQLTVFCKVLLVSDWSSLRCSGFILDSSNRTWSPVQTETVRRPSLFEFTVFGPAHEGRRCL